MLLLYGSLLLPVALAFLGRLRAFPRPPRRALLAGLAAAGAVAARCSASLGVLHIVLLAVALAASPCRRCSPRASSRRSGRCGCCWPAALACLLGPEVLYVRDEFDGSALYRMNTVFKLDYQAWLLLGLGGVMARSRGAARGSPRAAPRRAAGGALAVVLAAAAVYPLAGTNGRAAASRTPRRSTASAGCASAPPATSERSTG